MSTPRRSRRLHGDEPEIEVDLTQRVTPPRLSSPEGHPGSTEQETEAQSGGASQSVTTEAPKSDGEDSRSWETITDVNDPSYDPEHPDRFDTVDWDYEFHSFPRSDPGRAAVSRSFPRRTASEGDSTRRRVWLPLPHGMANAAAGGAAVDDEEARLQARARRALGAVERRFDQRCQDLHQQWQRARDAIAEYRDDPAAAGAGDALHRARLAIGQAKERRQELLTDRRTWIEHLYDSGFAPDEEEDRLARIEALYREATEEHERELEVGTKFIKEIDDKEKLQTDPVDSRLFKLPPLSIQEFTGDREKFVSFQQNFQALVGQQKLRDHQKLAHLRGCLKGKAADAVVSVGTEDADYIRAWDILTRRFGNKAELVREILASITRMELPFKSSPDVQRQYCDDVTAKYNRLVEVDPDSRNHNSTILPSIMNCFSSPIKSDLIKELGENPTVERFLERAQELISIEVRVRGKSQFSSQSKQPPKGNGSGNRRQGPGNGRGGFGGIPGGTVASLATTATRGQLKRSQGGNGGVGPSGFRGSNRSPSVNQGPSGGGSGAPTQFRCGGCGQTGHGLASCAEFKKLPMRGRLEKVRQARCCFKCLRSGHFGRECTQNRKCNVQVDGRDCGKTSHHPLLHRAPLGGKNT